MANHLINNRTDRRHLKQAADIAHQVCHTLIDTLEPGMALSALEQQANRLLAQQQSSAPFKRFDEYGYAICVSINDGIVNGPPLAEITLTEGDVVSIAVGSEYRGLHGKAAQTRVLSDHPPSDVVQLLEGTAALFDSFPTDRFSSLNALIAYQQTLIEDTHGLTLLAKTGGCGIGKQLHQFPPVPNRLEELDITVPFEEGMAFTLMPMTSLGPSKEWFLADDGWTYLTQDGALAAHVGHMMLYTDGCLTRLN
ncbi:MAG: M24 family metallopeptidase [Cyanobacteria bacterium HKST-UBA06]|nr:M24 family metallopeptidase [Cyanobacteria bacterium HKST-UBA05]MCA9807977.1 M24 family metallopeptidase [Cyanobacteria bacterium HKST-UBA06]